MGGLAASQTSLAVAALTRRAPDLALRVIEADSRIDDLRDTVDEIAMSLLTLRGPMGGELRALLAVMKVAGHLERIGDNARAIARRVSTLLDHGSIPPVGALHRMARENVDMVERVVDAYFARAPIPADEIRDWTSGLAEVADGLFRQMLTYMLETPRHIGPATHLIFIGNALERVGEHAAAIAASVAYIVSGEIPPEERVEGVTPIG